MQSNSKLGKAGIIALAAMAASAEAAGVEVFHFRQFGVTVAVRESGAEGYRVSVAVASPDERKFRPKVGKFYALDRMLNGESIYVANDGYRSPVEVAEQIAEVVSHPDWTFERNEETGALYEYEDAKAEKRRQKDLQGE